MKKVLVVFFTVFLFSCATQPDKKSVNLDEKKVDQEQTTSEIVSGKSEDGAPTYLYSENDRTKAFKKIGAGTGISTAEIADNAKISPIKKDSRQFETPDTSTKVLEKPSLEKGEVKEPSKSQTENLNAEKTENEKPSTKTDIFIFEEDSDNKTILETINIETSEQESKKTETKEAEPEKLKSEITVERPSQNKAKAQQKTNPDKPEKVEVTKASDNLIVFDENIKKAGERQKIKTPTKEVSSESQKETNPTNDLNQRSSSNRSDNTTSNLQNESAKQKMTETNLNLEQSKTTDQKTPNLDFTENTAKTNFPNMIAKTDTLKKSDIENAPKENQLLDEKTKTEEGESEYFSEFPVSTVSSSQSVLPSRSVTVNQGQRLKVLYPGEKWVFLGEQTSQKGLNYEQRRFQNGNTEFTFNAQNTGNYILNFSRYDAYSNEFIKDAIEVTVANKVSNAPPYVNAPEYVLPAPMVEDNALKPLTQKAQANQKSQQLSNNDIIIPQESPKPIVSNFDLLERAKRAIAKGDAKSAIDDLNLFLKTSVDRLDEAYFYLGQAYEINGSEKNIKEAYKAYNTVTKSFAGSAFWSLSDERIRYIKRFFINIE